MNKLTIKQENFCNKYLERGNASEAYRCAYSCGKMEDGRWKMEDGGDREEQAYQRVVFKAFSELTDNQLRTIESVKQGKSGIELKLHGKSWTIDRICKMLGFDESTKHEVTGKDGKPLHPEPLIIEIIDKRSQVDGKDTDK